MERRRQDRGTALLIAVVVVVIMVGLATGFLVLSAAQGSATVNNQTRIQSFYVAEAGLNAAIAEARSGIDTDGDGLGVLAAEPHGGGTFSTVAFLVDGATVTPVTAGTSVPGAGNAELRIQSTGTYQGVVRRLEVSLDLGGAGGFVAGLFGDDFVTVSGTVATDSYDSSLGPYAAQATNVDGEGLPYARDDGDVGSNGPITISGTVDIRGDAVAGPSYSTSISGATVVTGSIAPATSPTPLPPVVYSPPPIPPTDFQLSGKGTTAIAAGDYHYSKFTLGGSRTLTISGDVTLYVDGDVSISGTSAIQLLPGATLTIEHGAGSINISGTGLVNDDGRPPSLAINSASTTGSINISGTSDFYGAVNAPQTEVKISGTSDAYGAVIGRSITMSGTADFHYDEALGALGGGAPTYDVLSWQELPPP